MVLRGLLGAAVIVAALGAPLQAEAQSPRHEDLANLPFNGGFPCPGQGIAALKDELVFQRAVQSYLWALPALNMYGMKEGSEKVFGKGYNVLPIFKDRLNAKTLITTPNSDVIYALGYLDLKEDGPMVIEVPPGLQGILDDFWQRPICSEGEIDGRDLVRRRRSAGSGQGQGRQVPDPAAGLQGHAAGRLLHLPLAHLRRVRVLARLLQGPASSSPSPSRVMEQTRIYPLGKEASAKPMQFPNASATPANMLYPQDGTRLRHARALHRARVRRPSRHGDARHARRRSAS